MDWKAIPRKKHNTYNKIYNPDDDLKLCIKCKHAMPPYTMNDVCHVCLKEKWDKEQAEKARLRREQEVEDLMKNTQKAREFFINVLAIRKSEGFWKAREQ